MMILLTTLILVIINTIMISFDSLLMISFKKIHTHSRFQGLMPPFSHSRDEGRRVRLAPRRNPIRLRGNSVTWRLGHALAEWEVSRRPEERRKYSRDAVSGWIDFGTHAGVMSSPGCQYARSRGRPRLL